MTLSRPDPVRIDDLANPKFPTATQEIMDMVAPLAADLSFKPDDIFAAAKDETGLNDFGDDWFREPLSVALRAYEDEAGFSAWGKLGAHTQMVGHMRNRLRVENYINENPETVDEQIVAPIIIIGQPRTGTTHLHNLLAQDQTLRSLPYWESLEPVPSEAERQAGTADAGRQERCAVGLDVLNTAMPYFKRMHDMTVNHVHEEIQLMAIGGSTQLFETLSLVPSWRDWYLANDQTPAYEYLRRVLACCQHLRGGTRWVLKSPQHVEQIPALLKTFPDATFVFTHRDPVAVITSTATMITYLTRFSAQDVDPRRIGEYWADRVETMLNAGMHHHQLLPPQQTIDVDFNEFMSDDLAMVERIYQRADQPFTAEARAAMDLFMVDHPRGVNGGVIYDLEGDFGLDSADLRRRFTPYTDYFGVPLEA